MESILFVLSGKGCSGRGVRWSDVTAAERDKISKDSAIEVGADSVGAEYGIVEARNLVCACVRAVTKEPVESSDALISLPDSAWIELNPQKLLANPSEATYYNRLFSAKEDDILDHIARRRLSATISEVDAILGKAIMASSP